MPISIPPDDPPERPRRVVVAREWIIFAICMGLGGHIVLGIVLHAPEVWPWQEAGGYALLVGLSVYVAAQLARSVWWMIRDRRGAGRRGHPPQP